MYPVVVAQTLDGVVLSEEVQIQQLSPRGVLLAAGPEQEPV